MADEADETDDIKERGAGPIIPVRLDERGLKRAARKADIPVDDILSHRVYPDRGVAVLVTRAGRKIEVGP